MASERKTVRLKVRRQGSPTAPAYWEELEVPYLPKMNVLACLMDAPSRSVIAATYPSRPAWAEAGLLPSETSSEHLDRCAASFPPSGPASGANAAP